MFAAFTKYNPLWLLMFSLCYFSLDLGELFAQEPQIASETTEETDIESDFFEKLNGGNASQAESILEAILQNSPTSQVNPAQMILAMGNYFCEVGNYSSALKWFERLAKDYGKCYADEENKITFDSLISGKLAWLKNGGKRPWAFSDPIALGNRIFEGLSKNDPKILADSLSEFDTYVGWWASEYELTPRESLLEHIQKNLTASLTWDNVEEFKKAFKSGEKLLHLNIHGWKEMEGYKNIQFAIHATPEGWEWRGIILGEEPK